MTHPPYRAVIFDLDGTLVDTLSDITQAVNFALGQLGSPLHDTATVRGFVGQGVEQLMSAALPSERAGDLQSAVALFRNHYDQQLLGSTRPYPGIPEALQELVDANILLAVLSNKYEPATRHIVSTLFPPHWFAQVRGQRPGVPLKPDPTSALDIAAQLGVSAVECAVVGDLAADINTAKLAGMTPIGVAWGFGHPSILQGLGAQRIVLHPSQLPEILLNIPG